MIKILLDAGADPNLSFGNHKSPLYCAVWNANPANANIVKMLLDAGADPNQGWLAHDVRYILGFFSLSASDTDAQ